LCDYDRVTSVQIFVGSKISPKSFVYGLVTVALLATVGLYGLSRLLLRKLDVHGGCERHGAPRTQAGARRRALGLHGLCAAGASAAALPNLAVCYWRRRRDWYGAVLAQRLHLGSLPLGARACAGGAVHRAEPALRSLSTAFDLVLGFAIAWVVVRSSAPGRKLLDALAMLPLSVPGLVLAFGYLAISREGRPLAMLDPARDPTCYW